MKRSLALALTYVLAFSPPLMAGDQDVAKAAAAEPPMTVSELCQTLEARALERGLPGIFLVRLIWKESRFNPLAVSPKGAQGIAQFMPITAAARGLVDPFDPRQAVAASATLLAELTAEFGNLGLAAAAYNAGPERARYWLAGKSRLPRETRDFVQFITGWPAETWKDAQISTLSEEVATLSQSLQAWCRGLPSLRSMQMANRPALVTRQTRDAFCKRVHAAGASCMVPFEDWLRRAYRRPAPAS